MHFTYRSRPLVAAACLVAMLSGCGGGSSGTMPDDDMMTGGDPMTGGNTTGHVGLMAGMDRRFSEGRTIGLADDGMTTVTRTGSGWELTVHGNSVEFSDSELGAVEPGFFNKFNESTNVDVWFWSDEEGGFEGAPEFEYLDIYGFSYGIATPGADLATFDDGDYVRGSYANIVHGIPTSDMPVSGTATYEGRVEAREWRDDDPVFARDSTVYNGDFDMIATFGASGAEVAGTFSFTGVTGGIIPFRASTSGNQLSVSGLRIDQGHFAGYENIGVRAAFFGPAAAEAGGVFEGDNPAAGTLIHGYFAGAQQ